MHVIITIASSDCIGEGDFYEETLCKWYLFFGFCRRI